MAESLESRFSALSLACTERDCASLEKKRTVKKKDGRQNTVILRSPQNYKQDRPPKPARHNCSAVSPFFRSTVARSLIAQLARTRHMLPFVVACATALSDFALPASKPNVMLYLTDDCKSGPAPRPRHTRARFLCGNLWNDMLAACTPPPPRRELRRPHPARPQWRAPQGPMRCGRALPPRIAASRPTTACSCQITLSSLSTTACASRQCTRSRCRRPRDAASSRVAS